VLPDRGDDVVGEPSGRTTDDLVAGQDKLSRPASPAADQVSELIPFDAQARKALELTFREALRLGHNYIGTEHILLALLELGDGTGVLAGLGVDKATAETTITDAVAAVLAADDEK
jgi:hypothetical protein